MMSSGEKEKEKKRKKQGQRKREIERGKENEKDYISNVSSNVDFYYTSSFQRGG